MKLLDEVIVRECEILSLYRFWIPGTRTPSTNRLKAI
jgi:hypothetical protein